MSNPYSYSTTPALCMNGTAVTFVRYNVHNVLPSYCYWSDAGCDITHIATGLYRNLLGHPQRPEISLFLWLYKGGKNSHWSHHHNDVTWASLRLTPNSDQQERNIKAPYHWPFVMENHWSQNGSVMRCGRRLVMTPSYEPTVHSYIN